MNYIGFKMLKSEFDNDKALEVAGWCNEVQTATWQDMGDYYECVPCDPPEPMPPLPPTLEEQMQEISEALLTTTIEQEELISQLTAQNEALHAQLTELSDAMVELMFSE